MSPKPVAFFCDECGTRLSTANACPRCKRVLCFEHYYGAASGPLRRKDGLCVKCAGASKVKDEEAGQTRIP